MSIRKKVFDGIVDAVIRLCRFDKANVVSCGISEKIEPIFCVTHRNIKYFLSCPNNLTRWRAETYFTKEPETIEWIDTFQRGDVLFDIGANIGLYSIYAAKKNVKVIAFEPESQNYALINKNVYLNNCEDQVMVINIALSDTDCLDYLNIPSFQAGSAINCFKDTIDWNSESFIPSFKQGILSFSLDSFLLMYPVDFPTHIKIDVDGIEPKIIRGAQSTLSNKKLKSLSIEINEALPEHLEILDNIKSHGFGLISKRHADMFEGGRYAKCFNYLFVRDK